MGTAASPGGPGPFLVYLNLGQGITMKYPATWQKFESSGVMGFFVLFRSPQEGPTDVFMENLNLIIQTLPGPMTLDAFVQYSLAQARQMSVNILESGPSSIAGLTAHKMVYTGFIQSAGGPLPGKFLALSALAHGKAYVLTYTAQVHKFEAYLGTVQEMIESLEIG